MHLQVRKLKCCFSLLSSLGAWNPHLPHLDVLLILNCGFAFCLWSATKGNLAVLELLLNLLEPDATTIVLSRQHVRDSPTNETFMRT